MAKKLQFYEDLFRFVRIMGKLGVNFKKTVTVETLFLFLLVSVYIPQNMLLFLPTDTQPLKGLAGAAVRADKLCAVPGDRRGAPVWLAAFGADG